MRWTNSGRWLVGGTSLIALLIVQGISDNRPRVHNAPTDCAHRLPTKHERLVESSTEIAKVTFQIDQDDNGFQPPAPNLGDMNDLRNKPASDDATSQPSLWEQSEFEPPLNSGDTDRIAAAKPTETVTDTDITTGNTQATRPHRLPANWQVNPMFDMPISETDAGADSVVTVEPKRPEAAAAVNTTEKGENFPTESITPASRPVSSVLSQFATSASEANSVPQPSTTYYSRGPVGFTVSDSVAQKAANHIEYGKSLARRGATFAARQEFYNALQLVAQAIDSDLAEPSFTKSLSEALMALREASDFYVADSESQIGLNTAVVVETHSSKIVTIDEARSSTPIELMQKYYAFAEERFILASGHNVVSAEAMYCLGKLHSVMSRHDPHADRLDIAKAMVYHRACLECDPSNFRSANELGTLLARNGQLQEAKATLKRSLLIKQTPQAWKNLSIVHERMGEKDLAELANQEYVINSQAVLSNEIPSSIQWIDATSFNANAPLEYHESTAKQPNLLPEPPADDPAESKPEKLLDKVKKWF